MSLVVDYIRRSLDFNTILLDPKIEKTLIRLQKTKSLEEDMTEANRKNHEAEDRELTKNVVCDPQKSDLRRDIEANHSKDQTTMN